MCLSLRLKTPLFLLNLRSLSKLFYKLTALYGKDRCPVAALNKGILCKFRVTRLEAWPLVTSLDLRKSGAQPVMHFNTKTASLRYNCCFTDNQR